MTPLNVEVRLEFARAAVAVLRALEITDRSMRYKELANAIGLISDGNPWRPWHRQQVADILQLAGAAEQQSGRKARVARISFERIVNETGRPGSGVRKVSSIVRAKPATA